LECFDLLMIGFDALALRRQIEALEDVESHQRDEAIAVGWNLPHTVTFVVDGDRLDPLGLKGLEVFLPEESSVLPHEPVDATCEFTLVEGFGSCLGDRLKGTGVLGQANGFAGARCSSHGSKGVEPWLKLWCAAPGAVAIEC